MVQQGQVFQLASRNGEARWAYRYPGWRPRLSARATWRLRVGAGSSSAPSSGFDESRA